jgi:hypothetical protein
MRIWEMALNLDLQTSSRPLKCSHDTELPAELSASEGIFILRGTLRLKFCLEWSATSMVCLTGFERSSGHCSSRGPRFLIEMGTVQSKYIQVVRIEKSNTSYAKAIKR